MSFHYANGRSILDNNDWEITTLPELGELTESVKYFSIQAENFVGKTLVLVSEQINISENDKVKIQINSSALKSGEGWTHYVIGVSSSSDENTFQQLARIPIYNTIDGNLNIDDPVSFPILINITNNSQLTAAEVVTELPNLENNLDILLHGTLKKVESNNYLYEYFRYKNNETSGTNVIKAYEGCWIRRSTSYVYISSFVDIGGAGVDLKNVTNFSSIDLVEYAGDGTVSLKVPYYLKNNLGYTLQPETGLTLGVQVSGIEKTELFSNSIFYKIKGVVNTATGELRTTNSTTGITLDIVDKEYTYNTENPVVYIKDFIQNNEALLIHVYTKFLITEFEDLLPSGYLQIYFNLVSPRSSYSNIGTLFEKGIIFNKFDKRRILPNIGLSAIVSEGTGITKSFIWYSCPTFFSNLIENLNDQKLYINILGNISVGYVEGKNNILRAVVDTTEKESILSDWSEYKPVANNKSLELNIEYGCDSDLNQQIRSDYPDIIANNWAFFNPTFLNVYVQKQSDSEIRVFRNIPYNAHNAIDEIIINDWELGEVVTNIPTTKASFFDPVFNDFSQSDVTGSFVAGNYRVAHSYVWSGNTISDISHDVSLGCITEAQLHGEHLFGITSYNTIEQIKNITDKYESLNLYCVTNNIRYTYVQSSTLPADDKYVLMPVDEVGRWVAEIIEANRTFVKNIPPTITDDYDLGFKVGDKWLDLVDEKEYTLLDGTIGAAHWSHVGGIGHIIQNDGISIEQRKRLDFVGTVTLTDDPDNDKTIVTIEAIDGVDGKSAYELAVQEGYVGTLEQWLFSLEGTDGIDGVDGKSLYELAVEEGFVGTREEYLESLGSIGLDLGAWDDSETFENGIKLDGSGAKIYFPLTDTETRLARVMDKGEFVYDIEEDGIYFGNGVTLGGISIRSQAQLDIDWETAQPGALLGWDGSRLTFGDPLEALGLGSIFVPLTIKSVNANPTSVKEEEPVPIVFTITLSRASSQHTTITYKLLTESTQENGILIIPNGETFGTVTLNTLDFNDDIYNEEDRFITFTILTASNNEENIVFPGDPLIVQIVDDELAPGIDVAFEVPVKVTVTPGSSLEFGGAPLIYTIEIDPKYVNNLEKITEEKPVVVTYELSGTAVEEVDYEAIPEKIATIEIGDTSTEVVITPLENIGSTEDHSVILSLTGSSYGDPIDPLKATAIISDNNPKLNAPTFFSGSVSENSGDPLVFRITQNRLGVHETIITYTLTGTAVEGTNYQTIPSKTASIPIGETETFVEITPIDNEATQNDTVIFTVTNATVNSNEITYVDTSVVGTILGSPVTLSTPIATTSSVVEGDGDPIVFTINQNRISAYNTTFTYTLGGTAVEGTDYSAIVSKTVTIPSGQTSAIVEITPINNDNSQINRTIILTLSSATNNGNAITYSNVGATATIVDDDIPLAINAPTVSPASVNENGGILTYTITQNRISINNTVVTYSLTGTATEGTDYQSIPVKTVTISAGQTTATISVTAIDNDEANPNRTVILTQTGATNNGNPITFSTATSTGTIVNEDVAITISAPTVSPASVTEGTNTPLVFRFAQNRISTFNTVITYLLGGTAIEGEDYQAIPVQEVTIPAGSTSTTLSITPINNDDSESNRTIIITQTGATNNGKNLTFSSTTVTGTIIDDDIPLAINSPSVNVNTINADYWETLEPIIFTVTQNRISINPTTVTYSLTGTAVEGTDYQNIVNKTIIIPAGQTTASVVVTPIDRIIEGSGTVVFTQTAAINNGNVVTYSTTTSTTTIVQRPFVAVPTVSPSSVVENGGVMVFTISQYRTSSYDTTINYSLGGTAVEGEDYQSIPIQEVVITSGTKTITVTVNTINDDNSETNKTIILTQTGAVNNNLPVTYSTSVATGTIVDDDIPLIVNNIVTSSSTTVGENVTYTLNLNRLSSNPTTINYSLLGTAIEGTNYQTISNKTLTIPAGESSAQITIIPTNVETLNENKTINLRIDSATNNGLNISYNSSLFGISILSPTITYLTFDGTQLLKDSSSNNVNVAMTGSNYTGIGKYDSALGFNVVPEGVTTNAQYLHFKNMSPSLSQIPSGSAFTVEFWFKTDVNDSYLMGNNNTNTRCIFEMEGLLYVAISANTGYLTSGWSGTMVQNTGNNKVISDNTWHHLSLSANGTTAVVHLDGKILFTLSYTPKELSFADDLTIGEYNGAVTASGPYQGLIDSLRITKGFARYSNDFNPETDTGLAPYIYDITTNVSSINENSTQTLDIVAHTTQTRPYDLIATYSLTGTAIEGTDYNTIAQKQIVITAGTTSGTAAITLKDNVGSNVSKTLFTKITGATYNGTPVNHIQKEKTVTINNVSFSVLTPVLGGTGTARSFAVSLNRITQVGSTIINYIWTGSAVKNVDFTEDDNLNGVLTIGAGNTTANINITLTGAGSNGKTIVLTLTGATVNGSSVSYSTSSVLLTIAV